MKDSITEQALTRFSDQILTCMSKLDRLLVPPFEEVPFQVLEEFVVAIQQATRAEAVSIFLVKDDDPNVLMYRAGKGYKAEYRASKYFRNGAFLTSYVCRRKIPINASGAQLEQGLVVELKVERDKPATMRIDNEKATGQAEGRERSTRVTTIKERVPFQGRCGHFIESGKFLNIIAVPILFDKKSLGVLKLENKGKDRKKNFPEEDFALARILASIIGVAYQQRIYAMLWNEGERIREQSRSLETYVQKVTEILTKHLNAECASVFIKDQSDSGEAILRYAGGVGYKDPYKSQIYKLDEPASAFTSYIFQDQEQIPRSLTENQIYHLNIPYTGACRSQILSGSFRNILAFPLRGEDSKRLGVLKIENKLPEQLVSFDSHDEEVTKAFVEKQIVPTITKLMGKLGSALPITKGYRLLEKELDRSIYTRREALIERLKNVQRVKQMSKGKITAKDCANYLQISKPHYFRLIQKLVPGADPEADERTQS